MSEGGFFVEFSLIMRRRGRERSQVWCGVVCKKGPNKLQWGTVRPGGNGGPLEATCKFQGKKVKKKTSQRNGIRLRQAESRDADAIFLSRPMN